MNDNGNVLYVFLDEGGNLDFSPTGTRYFTLTLVTKERPFNAFQSLVNLRYDFIEEGLDIEYFHATEDRQAVRNKVFRTITEELSEVTIDCMVVEKAKTIPPLQVAERFYPHMLGRLLKYVLERSLSKRHREVVIFTDRIPVKRKLKATEKAIKTTLKAMLPNSAAYRVYHHASMSNVYLQVADYCNWAILRKWTRNDLRSYRLIERMIRSEFEIFKNADSRFL